MYRKTRRLRRNKRRSTKRRTHRQKKMRGGAANSDGDYENDREVGLQYPHWENYAAKNTEK